MKKTKLILLASFFTIAINSISAQAQIEAKEKLPLYGLINVGYGNTFLRGALGDKETINDGRGYGRNDGYSFSSFYYLAPKKLLGLGVGTGIKGFLARPNEGGDNETYSYNYYYLGIGIKDYFISKKFNEGLAFKTSFGYGPSTERMKFGNTNTYNFQNAYGFTVIGGFAYAIPIKNGKTAFNIDFDYEYSSKNASVTGSASTVKYIHHHVSLNLGLMF